MRKSILLILCLLFTALTHAQADSQERSFSATVADATEMNAIPLTKVIRGQHTFRLDTETWWAYDGTTWVDTQRGFLPGAGGSVAFSSLTGNPSDNANLNTALNLKQDIGANIDATQIANGSVSNAEFQRLLGVTSPIQVQINNLDTTKQEDIVLTTTGTTGAATLVGSTLNIPQYAGGGSTPLDQTPTSGNTTNALSSDGAFIEFAKYLPLLGGSMTGNIDLDGFALNEVGYLEIASNPNSTTIRYENSDEFEMSPFGGGSASDFIFNYITGRWEFQGAVDFQGGITENGSPLSGSGNVNATNDFAVDNRIIVSDGTGKNVKATGVEYDPNNGGGLIISGVLNMAGNNIDMSLIGKITDMIDPTSPQDAATMAYVDQEVTAAANGGSIPNATQVNLITATDYDGDGTNETNVEEGLNALKTRIAAIDDSGVGSSQSISIEDASAVEGNNIVFTVRVDGGGVANSNIDFIVDTFNGTATLANLDYEELDGFIASINAGTSSTTISVATIDDATIELDENFTITITDAQDTDILKATATGTIINDDASSVDNPFFLAANGETIVLKDGNAVGTVGLADNDPSGKTYTAVDNTTLFALDPATDDYTSVCTTLVTDVSLLFKNQTTFNQDIGNWDVSNVAEFRELFRNTDFDQDLSNWDMSSATRLDQMFRSSSFNRPINNWDVSNVTQMDFLFNQNSDFNQPLNSWDVSSVTDMTSVFNNATSFNQDISSWNVSSATDMTNMLRDASSFNQDIGIWDTSSVTDMTNMFLGASIFNQDLSAWCVVQIPTEPTGFDGASWTAAKPNWGTTCGTPPPSSDTGVITLFDDDVNVTEGVESSVTFVARIGGTITDNVTVDYTTNNSSASNVADYIAQTGTITFTPSISSVNIVIDIVDDTVFESTETFTVTLSNIQSTIGASFEDDATTLVGSANIIDNDAPTGSTDNLLSNGTFNDASEWTLLNDATATGGILTVPSAGRIQSSFQNWSATYYNVRPQIYYETRRYRLTFEGRCTSCGNDLDVGQRFVPVFSDPLTSDWETYVIEFDGSGQDTGNDITFGGEGIGDVFELRNMKFEDVGDNSNGGAKAGASSQITFYTDFEFATNGYQQWGANGVPEQFQNQWEVDNGDPRDTTHPDAAISTGRDGTGTAFWLGAYNFILPDDTPNRNEVGKDIAMPLGEMWNAFSYYVDESLPEDRILMQMRVLAPGGSNTVNAITIRQQGTTDGEFRLSLCTDAAAVDQFSPGNADNWNGASTGTVQYPFTGNFQGWNDVVIHYKPAFGADYDSFDTAPLIDEFGYDPATDGFIEIWINGTKIIDHVGTTIYRHGRSGGDLRWGLTPKIGTYWGTAFVNETNSAQGNIYYDNYIIWVGPNGTYADVDPSGN
jgi:surface protein